MSFLVLAVLRARRQRSSRNIRGNFEISSRRRRRNAQPNWLMMFALGNYQRASAEAVRRLPCVMVEYPVRYRSNICFIARVPFGAPEARRARDIVRKSLVLFARSDSNWHSIRFDCAWQLR